MPVRKPQTSAPAKKKKTPPRPRTAQTPLEVLEGEIVKKLPFKELRRHWRRRRFRRYVVGWSLIVIGAIFYMTPLFGATLIFLFGLATLAQESKGMRHKFTHLRGKHPWLNKKLIEISPKMPNSVQHFLKRTKPAEPRKGEEKPKTRSNSR